MMIKDKPKILMSGGGTGGHIFPAIAIANRLKEKYPEAEILFVGAKGRMEMEKVPAAGYDIEGLWISGFQRSLTLDNLSFPFKLIRSLCKASKIIRKFKPDVAVGTGGYASGPLLYRASKKGVPTLILEQNSYPGVTNKILSKTVDKVCVAYDGMEKYFPKEKIVVTGSPIRKEIMELKVSKEESLQFFGLKDGMPVLLIIGGSQGARGINQAIMENLDRLAASGIQIIWQTGKSSFEEAKKRAEKSPFAERIKVLEFIAKMDMAYTAADLIVSRAGAIALAEIVAVSKPAVFIPLPSAAEDHQTKNALTLTQKKAGILLPEKEAVEKITDVVNDLIHSEKKRKEIEKNLAAFKTGDATEKIVNEIEKLINKG
jgi:UDP-N-acetylglucosamine--N-acetylmuramyl-(pentapeptide) pyrophosphoryl-undecaprenol N-acetylglucosamine transferase